MLHWRDGIAQVMSSAGFHSDMMLGFEAKQFSLCFIRPEYLSFSCLLANSKQAFICLALSRGFHWRLWSAIQPRSVECYSDSWLSASFSQLHTWILEHRQGLGHLSYQGYSLLIPSFAGPSAHRKSPGCSIKGSWRPLCICCCMDCRLMCNLMWNAHDIPKASIHILQNVPLFSFHYFVSTHEVSPAHDEHTCCYACNYMSITTLWPCRDPAVRMISVKTI